MTNLAEPYKSIFLSGSLEELEAWQQKLPGGNRTVFCGRIKGREAQTLAGFFGQLKEVFQIPAPIINWQVTLNYLSALNWLPADEYWLIVENSADLLEGEPPANLGVLKEVITDINRERKGRPPLNIAWHSLPEDEAVTRRKLADAGFETEAP